MADSIRQLQALYADDLAVVYRQLPIHRFAHAAGVAAECAGRVGAFDRYADALFAHQDSIGKKSWTAYARVAKIADTVAFARCMKEAAANEAVARDSVAAAELGANATPTFLINELMFVGSPGFQEMSRYVRRARDAKPGTVP